MSSQITIEVPDRIKQRAVYIAHHTHQRIEDVIVNVLESAMPVLPIEMLPDDEVLALAKSMMPPTQEERFHYLLEQNREGTLASDERLELDRIMDAYEQGLLRKSQALVVAVGRGLMELPKP